MREQELGYFRNEIEFLAKEENAEKLLQEIIKLSPSWIKEPQLNIGGLFDSKGDEKYCSIVGTVDPEIKYVSGVKMMAHCKDTGCLHKKTTLTSVARDSVY